MSHPARMSFTESVHCVEKRKKMEGIDVWIVEERHGVSHGVKEC